MMAALNRWFPNGRWRFQSKAFILVDFSKVSQRECIILQSTCYKIESAILLHRTRWFENPQNCILIPDPSVYTLYSGADLEILLDLAKQNAQVAKRDCLAEEDLKQALAELKKDNKKV